MSLMLKSLSVGYAQPIVQSLSFAVTAGEPLALLGPNGAGKTTLLRTMLGLIPPLAGEILWDQATITTDHASQRANYMAYVPQRSDLPAEYTVHEFVLLGLLAENHLFATPTEQQHHRTSETLAALGIEKLEFKDYPKLSGGEQQLVLIARALARSPRCLILDEPTAHLDYGQQLRIMDRVKQLSESGIILMFSTHVPDHAINYSTQVLLADKTNGWSVGNTTDVLNPLAISRLYGLSQQQI